jgi:hypothetical protein
VHEALDRKTPLPSFGPDPHETTTAPLFKIKF